MKSFFALLVAGVTLSLINGRVISIKDNLLPSVYPCDYSIFSPALATFMTDGNIQNLGTNLTTNGSNLQKAINLLITNAYTTDQSTTEEAFYQLCAAQKTFYGSIGYQNIAGCLNVLNLVDYNYTLADAYLFEQIFTSLNYQCSSAFRINNAHINDYAFTLINNATMMAAIESNFYGTINLPSTTDQQKCAALKKYHDNMGKLFGGNGKSSEFAFVTCEQYALYMLIKVPQCYSQQYYCNFNDFLNVN
uniref:Uncharacterized protein n=1 Tax=Strongyloides venezuelensis TaxID=75913 RepID=A0A0K0FNZ6_STRVS